MCEQAFAGMYFGTRSDRPQKTYNAMAVGLYAMCRRVVCRVAKGSMPCRIAGGLPLMPCGVWCGVYWPAGVAGAVCDRRPLAANGAVSCRVAALSLGRRAGGR